jgi:chromosome segregation ATPase
MKVPLQQEILELLKQKLLPELELLGQRIAKADQDSRERDAQLLEAIRAVDMASRERDAALAAAITSVQADVKVLTGRVDNLDIRIQERFAEIDKRFEQVDKRFEQVEQSIRELHADLREVRSLMFVGKAQQMGYQLHDK